VPIGYIEDLFDSDDGMPDWAWHEYMLTVSIGAGSPAIGKQLGIELATIDAASGNNSWFGFDNVRLDGELAGAAVCISPGNGEIDVPVTTILEWDAPPTFTPLYYDLYFGDDANALSPHYFGNVPEFEKENRTTWDPEGDLEFSTTYYWRVDSYEPNDTGEIYHLGRVWRFTTMPEEVVIVTEPRSATVPTGGTAEFSVEATSPTTITYEWYKVGNDVDVLSSTDTLTMENVQLDDEGYYYCELTNEVGTVVSAQVQLLTERMMGWWKLDGDLTDSVQEVVPGVPSHDGTALNGDPNYIVGVNGSGIEFFADGRIVVIPDTGEYFNFHPQGMTVSIWVWAQSETNNWDGVISKHLRGDTWVGWLIDVNARSDWGPTGAHFTIRPHGDLFGNDDDGDIFDGDWHLVTGVVDPVTETTRIYIDGIRRNESGTIDLDSIVMNDEPLVFGAEDQTGVIPFTGMIDDVRLYNYVLDDYEVATLYTDFVDRTICPDNPPYDLNGDCRVDIDDVVELSLSWLMCNRIPAELCD
jgi:hypothetical protein